MKLPVLFQEIIDHDSERPGMNQRVVPIGIAHAIKDWRKRRNELTVSAEKFIRHQKGASG